MNGLLPIGVIGCGDIALSGHLPAVQRHPGIRLIAVADAHPNRSAHAASVHGCRAVDSLDDMVAMGVRAVIVATPPDVTPRLTREALAAGLDVLCEKPMALDVFAAEQVAAAAREHSRIVQVGFKNRFSPLVRAVHDWIKADKLGSPLVFTLGSFDEALDPGDSLHSDRIRSFLAQAPSFVHEGAHFADYLAMLTESEPIRVSAIGQRSRPDFGTANFVSTLVEYANGDIARMEIGWMFPINPAGEFRVLGPDGVAIVDRPGGVATLHRRDGSEQVTLAGPWNDVCFDLQLQHFIDCVRSRSTPEASAEAGIASLRLGRWVAECLSHGRPAGTGGGEG